MTQPDNQPIMHESYPKFSLWRLQISSDGLIIEQGAMNHPGLMDRRPTVPR